MLIFVWRRPRAGFRGDGCSLEPDDAGSSSFCPTRSRAVRVSAPACRTAIAKPRIPPLIRDVAVPGPRWQVAYFDERRELDSCHPPLILTHERDSRGGAGLIQHGEPREGLHGSSDRVASGCHGGRSEGAGEGEPACPAEPAPSDAGLDLRRRLRERRGEARGRGTSDCPEPEWESGSQRSTTSHGGMSRGGRTGFSRLMIPMRKPFPRDNGSNHFPLPGPTDSMRSPPTVGAAAPAMSSGVARRPIVRA